MRSTYASYLLLATIAGGLASSEAATFIVTNTSPSASVSGSLPNAVSRANASPGLDFIQFNIPGSGVSLISLTAPLVLTDQVVIDGETEPGYAGSPLIYLQGSASIATLIQLTNDSSPGSTLTSSGSTVQGLGLYLFAESAVTISPQSVGNWIQDNFVGFRVDSNGTVHLTTDTLPPPGDHPAGVRIESSLTTLRNNTIAGVYNGVIVGEDLGSAWTGAPYNTNSIQANRIGIDPTGSTITGYGDLGDGIYLGQGAFGTFVGPNNVVSGNSLSGVRITGQLPLTTFLDANWLFQNRIGTDNVGSTGMPNGEWGVVIEDDAFNSIIGDLSAFHDPYYFQFQNGNIISGNTLGGVDVGTDDSAYSNVLLVGNIIGLNATQTAAIPGQAVGVALNGSSGVPSNAFNSYYGGNPGQIAANVIAGNEANGISVYGSQFVIDLDWIGQSWAGTLLPNQGYGTALLPGSTESQVYFCNFGTNLAGNIYIDPSSGGNYIMYNSP